MLKYLRGYIERSNKKRSGRVEIQQGVRRRNVWGVTHTNLSNRSICTVKQMFDDDKNISKTLLPFFFNS